MQEEFFYIFNVLFEFKQQIIFICDCYLKEVDKFELWLKLCLGWGLLVVIELLDFEICVVIFLFKVYDKGVEVSESVVMLLVKCICFNVCDLEGVFNMLVVKVNFFCWLIIIDFVEEMLCDLLVMYVQVVMILNIQKIVGEYFNVCLQDLLFKWWVCLFVCL